VDHDPAAATLVGWIHAAAENGSIQRRRQRRRSSPFGIGCLHLGEHRLRVLRDQLVQHRALGFPAPIAGERLSPAAPDVRSYRPPATIRPAA